MRLFGGGDVEVFSRSDFRTVERTLEEPARAEAATQAMERINERMTSELQNRELSFDQLAEIETRVDSPEEAYIKVFDELWQSRREAHDEHIADVFIMRENMTREEWAAVFAASEQ
jgi:hypothetical protein